MSQITHGMCVITHYDVSYAVVIVVMTSSKKVMFYLSFVYLSVCLPVSNFT